MPLDAEQLATALAARFLENGNYEAAGPPLGHAAVQYAQAAAAAPDIDTPFMTETGFAGLAVHSVGFTPGQEEERVVIYVTRGSKKALKSLPEEVEGVPVDVKVMGKTRSGPAPSMAHGGPSYFFERNGRVACGGSCAPSGANYAGTLGALVRDGQRMLALSNNHVFAACNHTPMGMPILAPANGDASASRPAPLAIARHERIVELRSGAPDSVQPMQLDAAVAAIQNEDVVSSWQGDGKSGYDTPGNALSLQVGLNVKKTGRTTGLTKGIVEAFVPTPWVLPYKADRFKAVVWFSNTWTIRGADVDPFALAGDSGSLVVAEDGSGAVGLLFAVNSTGQYGIVMPIEDVLNAFGNLALVSGHGL